MLFACGPTRHLKEDQKLLSKVKLKSENSKFQEDLLSLSKQKPNRKFLGLFKIYLGVYNLYYNKEESKIKEKIGEPPVIYDSSLSDASVKAMHQYLNNRGYYNNEVSYEAKTFKKQKVKLRYQVNKGERYEIAKLNYAIEDSLIDQIVRSDSTNRKLEPGTPFDLDYLKDERERLEELIKNHGYYKFSREFILFEVDTFQRKKTANVNIAIKKVQDKYQGTDSLVKRNHRPFQIRKVMVRTNYNLSDKILNADRDQVDSIYFENYGNYEIKPITLARLITIRPGQLYSLERQEATYSNLSGLGIYSLVSIQYEDDYSTENSGLVVYIDLTPYKQKSLSVQTEGTNNGGNLGLNGNLTFQNKNTFKGAERLNVKFRGGLEVQQLLTEDSDRDLELGGGILPFNTFEFGPEVSLEIPRFLIPFASQKRFSVKGNPRTTFNASYNYQERPDYVRNVSSAFVAYSWNETSTKKHILQPFDLSYIKLDPSPEFQQLLEGINNPFLRNSYTDNLILALKYSFIFNNQAKRKGRNYLYFRVNAESAGNSIDAFSEGLNLRRNEDGSKQLAGIRYAQYVRSDFDLRYYQKLNAKTKMVYRLASGLGVPYGNSEAMPFEKSFFAGGANNIRAWRARELGPGALPDSSESDVDQIGNMQITTNLEYRFPISKLFEGAVFVDAGNIWNVEQEDSRESTEFEFSSLWRSTAMGVGAGLRLNFTFFILRFDIATPVKDPSNKNPYLIQTRWQETNLNFGIGYPF